MADVPPSPFDRFIERIWAMGGTDLLLLAGSPPAVRIDHVLRPLDGEPPLAAADVYRWVATVVGEEQAGAYRRDLEIDFSLGWRGRVRLRANAYHQRGLPAVALRFIPERIPTPDELGLPHPVRDWARMPQGLVLVTGPAGSGKSTTTASLIDQINRERACHIVTIEDPIEYVHLNGRSYVSQREVGADTHSFERALRSAVRAGLVLPPRRAGRFGRGGRHGAQANGGRRPGHPLGQRRSRAHRGRWRQDPAGAGAGVPGRETGSLIADSLRPRRPSA
jgi:twitching motility protein PilT